MAVFVVVSASFPLLDPTDPQKNTPVVITEDFVAQPWLYRVFYCYLGLLAFRQKYYFGWKNAEGANNLWLAGFEGYDNESKEIGWEGCNNMNILGFEFAEDLSILSREWNKKTSNWLTRYTYIRTGGSLWAVYATSAFWHGFYPGYYMFFLSVPLATVADRLAKKKLSPYFPNKTSKWSPYGIVGIMASMLVANYYVQRFAMLAGSWTWELYKSHYFVGHWLPVVYIGFLMVLPKKPKADADKKTK